jgi:bifunctional DNA-binding transcriptional regulator/antitoxin component of YhaV-PrlF toxin-antitoxin module
LGLKSGDRVVFELEDGKVILRKARPTDFDCERVMFPRWGWISSTPPEDLQLNGYRLREAQPSTRKQLSSHAR